ncbi:MAG: MATE family efflux transporter [Candidatus Enterenecus sp.]
MASIRAALGGRRRDVDMTEGSILRHLLYFSLPLLVGNVFQQLYNMVDTWVVGNYVSNEAFSAVGTVGPIINMLIGLFSGLASGAGAVISQYYGAKRFDRVEDTVHTAALMGLILCAVFTGVGIGMTPLMLSIMKTPANVLPEATRYLTIYFAGITGLLLYNMGSAILRAVGDSQRPFYFLLASALINTALDLLFVLKFGMGVEGVALATIIAQGVSAVLVTVTLMRTSSCVKVRLRKLAIHVDVLKKIFRVGIPAALQLAVTAFSNVFVQSYINFFGDNCMSGWTAYTKVDQLMFLPMQSLALAGTTFVGQNLGSGQPERARKGVRTAVAMAMVCTVVLMAPVLIFAPQLVAFFNSKPEVVEYGTLLQRLLSPFYVLCCVNQVLAGALRGAGNSRAPMIIMLSSFVVFRQIYLFIVANFISNQIVPIAMGYPAGWLVCSVLMLVYYKNAQLTRSRLVEE